MGAALKSPLAPMVLSAPPKTGLQSRQSLEPFVRPSSAFATKTSPQVKSQEKGSTQPTQGPLVRPSSAFATATSPQNAKQQESFSFSSLIEKKEELMRVEAQKHPAAPLEHQPPEKRQESKYSTRSASAPSLKIRSFDLKPLEKFDGNVLPTKGDVLRRYFFLRDNSRRSLSARDVAKLIYPEIVEIWAKIPCDTREERNVLDQITKVNDRYQVLKRVTGVKKDIYLADLNSCFDIGHHEAEKRIKGDKLRTAAQKEEDLAFLLDQKRSRNSYFSSADKGYQEKVVNKELRDLKGLKHLEISQQSAPSAMEAELEEEFDDQVGATASTSAAKDEDYQLPTDWNKYKVEGAASLPVGFNKNFASDPRVLAALDRTKTTNREATHLMGAFVGAQNVPLDEVPFSRSTLHRWRSNFRSRQSEAIKEGFVPPARATVHFDGKILEDFGANMGDHLAVMVSGDTDECRQGKLLSARMIVDGSGKTQAEEVVKCLEEWGIKDCIHCMVFDTTSSNTGWKAGAAVIIEEKCGRPLAWLPCRKHIHELYLRGAWEELFGQDQTPYFEAFKKFQKYWEADLWNKEAIKPLQQKKWMKTRWDHIVDLCSSSLKKDKMPRDDYREVMDLVLAVLGSPDKNFSFKKPGAFHKARWMAPTIYSLKMYLLRDELPNSFVNKEKLERYVIFTALFYTEHWLSVSSASDAPLMDLTLLQDMVLYQKQDKQVANAVLKKLSLHTWYLNQEYAPLSLFSSKVDDKMKAEIAKKLVQEKPTEVYGMGRPNAIALPDFSKERGRKAILNYKLTDFVMSGSHYLFDRLDFKKDWLREPVIEWKNRPDFQEMERFVKTLLVTNDAAERGVKLISDYSQILTKDSDERQQLLQVVEDHRKTYPDCNKTTLSRPLSFV